MAAVEKMDLQRKTVVTHCLVMYTLFSLLTGTGNKNLFVTTDA